MPNKVTVVNCYLRKAAVKSQHKIQAICFTLELPLSVEMVSMTRTIVVVQRKTLDEFGRQTVLLVNGELLGRERVKTFLGEMRLTKWKTNAKNWPKLSKTQNYNSFS